MKILIGNTGLIGKNLKDQQTFDYEFNSQNIQDIVDCPDECDLYLSCLPATKWFINQNIDQDLRNIQNIFSQISNKKYNNIYLFSTIDVYGDSPLRVDEDYSPNFSGFNYGSNRLLFENIIKQFVSYNNFYIFRLPALFGNYLKKNVIFDLLNNNRIENINLNSYYQWYNLKNLTRDIEVLTTKHNDSVIFNLFNEPIYTEKLIDEIFPEFNLNLKGNLITYDYKTKFSSAGYLYPKEEIMKQIGDFVYEIRNQ
jgi:nucleoside-diphosphate-sugar epimerase